mgnify:CR=1 FL=1
MSKYDFADNMKRAQASVYLMEVHGISRTPATLAKLACIGGGPKFRKAGTRTTIYARSGLDEWANSILSPVVENTAGLTVVK